MIRKTENLFILILYAHRAPFFGILKYIKNDYTNGIKNLPDH